MDYGDQTSGSEELASVTSTGSEEQMGQKQRTPEERSLRKKARAMVAVDDSQESFYALRWTLDKLFPQHTVSPAAETPPPDPDPELPPGRLEPESNFLLTLVHVMEPWPHYAHYPGGAFVVETATKSQEQNAARTLSRASQLCDEKKVAAEKVVLEGDPKEMICQAAERMGAEVLVVGSRGLGQIKRAFLGSVSDYCAHHAKCPVLIVKLPKDFSHAV